MRAEDVIQSGDMWFHSKRSFVCNERELMVFRDPEPIIFPVWMLIIKVVQGGAPFK